MTKKTILFEDETKFSFDSNKVEFVGGVARLKVFLDEAIIIPHEETVAEGFISLSAVPDPLVDCNFVIKIDSDFYYLLAGVLTISDQTFSQSSTMAEIEAGKSEISSFISSGKKIYFCPVLINTDGVTVPEIASYLLDYDFYAIPDDCNVCNVWGFLKDNCESVLSGTIKFYSQKPFDLDGNIVNINKVVTIRDNGFFEAEITISEEIIYYEINATDSKGIAWKKSGKILIPDQATAKLTDIIQ